MTAGWFFDGLVILSVMLWLVRLGVRGYLTPQTAASALVALVIFIAIARVMNRGPIRLALRVGVPIASLWIFVVIHTDGSQDQIMAAVTPLLALLIALLGVYVMIELRVRKEPTPNTTAPTAIGAAVPQLEKTTKFYPTKSPKCELSTLIAV
jgi:hypothetical protein